MKDIFTQIDKLKEEISQHRPFDEHKRQQIKEYYRIGLTYTSNALEGNTLTESETKVVLEEGITIGGKRLVDHLEALGHSDAFTYMYELLQSKTITEECIKKLHYLFYYRVDQKDAGVYRHEQVYLTGSHYPLPKPKEIAVMMEKMIEHFPVLEKEKHPVVFAALAHKELVFIHPFIDGNGRVARLLMNLILLSHGYTIAIIPPILRADYIRALEKAHKDDQEFIYFIARIVKETQQDYIRLFVE
ncbi:MAG: Fic family protein [Candidatus Babeliales bacterium]